MSDYIRESETREQKRQRMKRKRRIVMRNRIIVLVVILIIVLLSLFMCNSKKDDSEKTTTEIKTTKVETTNIEQTKQMETETISTGLTEDEEGQSDPLFLQKDPRWANVNYGDNTIGGAGCGPVCLSMVAFSLTRDDTITPIKVAKYAEKNGHYVKNAGTAWSLFTAGGEHFGLKVNGLSISESEMKNSLDNGAKLILSVKPGVFSKGHHIIEIYGYDNDGFKVNEPLSRKRSARKYKFDEFKGIIKAIWAYNN